MKKIFVLTICFTVFFFEKAFPQYYGERSVEKSFEQNDLFFQPNYINPYGIGSFSTVTPGIIDDPFLNLQINPARFNLDSAISNYFYADFRSYRQTTNQYQPVYPVLANESIMTENSVMYPYFYVESRPIIEPILSLGYLTTPLPSSLPGLFLGFSYQAIMEDSKYYSIPFGVYQSNLGADYNGKTMANGSDIPITTVSAGQDNMHHSGNLFSLIASYKFSPDLQIGFRFGRAFFKENGSYGNDNYWENYYYNSGSSLYYNIESRNQDYNHWDMSGGVEYKITAQTTIGISGGYLWGVATQDFLNRDTSNYSYNSNTDLSSGTTTQNWRHDGKTKILGLDLTSRLNDRQTIMFLYQYNKENVDIGLNSSVLDTGWYTYSYSYDTNYYSSISHNSFTAASSGGGSMTQTNQRFLVSLKWKFNSAAELDIGGILNIMKETENTNEPTISNGNSYDKNINNSTTNLYYDTTMQNKNIQWNFSVDKWSIDIPIIFTYKFSDMVSLLIGLDKQISEWQISDETLVIYYHNYTNDSYSGLTDKSNYGELYSSPQQNISDVNTTFLAGLTISPSKEFSVRLLLSPSVHTSVEGVSVSNFQWWLSVNLFP